MARHADGPWFRAAKNAWYTTIEGRKFSLGVTGKANRKAALDAWHKLHANGGRKDRPPTPAESPTVQALVDEFLADADHRLKPATVRQYRDDLSSLTKRFGSARADRVTAADLSRWLTRLPVSDTTKAIRIRSVSACLGWAVRNGRLADNPVKRVTRPRGRTRSESAVIGPDDHSKLLAAASPDFRLVLRLLYATGCRPGELQRITTETFYPEAGLVKLNEHKADRTGRPRLIYLPPDVLELLKTQAARHRSGPLLRSRKGVPWNTHSIGGAMTRTREKAGVTATAYGYRHTFATDGLANGLPEAHVAELLGHCSTTMLHKHYAHLTAKAGVLRLAAAAVRPAPSPTPEPAAESRAAV
jgi:integrase